LNDIPSGVFITVEGGEGAGKSTLVRYLTQTLAAKGLPTLSVREPGGTRCGEKIRQWLLERTDDCAISATTELLLFLASRAQHLDEVIVPALKQGSVVICDRFNDSTIAYQGAARGLGVPYVSQLCQLACCGVEPALTVLLDIDPQQGLQRCLRQSGTLDRIEAEALSFHNTVRSALLAQAEAAPHRYLVVDAMLPPQDIASRVLQGLSSHLPCFNI
jgi:dTMP kinase